MLEKLVTPYFTLLTISHLLKSKLEALFDKGWA